MKKEIKENINVKFISFDSRDGKLRLELDKGWKFLRNGMPFIIGTAINYVAARRRAIAIIIKENDKEVAYIPIEFKTRIYPLVPIIYKRKTCKYKTMTKEEALKYIAQIKMTVTKNTNWTKQLAIIQSKFENNH